MSLLDLEIKRPATIRFDVPMLLLICTFYTTYAGNIAHQIAVLVIISVGCCAALLLGNMTTIGVDAMHALNRDDSSRLRAVVVAILDWRALVLICIYTLLLLLVASIPCAGSCSRITVQEMLREPHVLWAWPLSLLLLWSALRLHGTRPQMAFVLLLPLAIILPGLIFFDHRRATFANTKMMTDIVYSQVTIVLCAALLWLRLRRWRRATDGGRAGRVLLRDRLSWQFIGYLLLLTGLYILLGTHLPKNGYVYDVNYWKSWATGILRHGLGHAYSIRKLNYYPLLLYVLAVFDGFQGNVHHVRANIVQLKLLILLFDWMGILIVALLCRQHTINPLWSLIILLNPAYLYNTLVWFQVDAIYTNLALLALALALWRKPLWSVMAFVIAFNTKPFALVWLPVLLCVLIPVIVQRKTRLVHIVGCVAGVQTMLVLPFLLSGELPQVLRVILNSTGDHLAAQGANNLWYLVLSDDPRKVSVYDSLAGLTYQQWGIGLFCLGSAFALFPIGPYLRYTVQQIADTHNCARVFLALTLIALNLFFWLTQMHQRYLHPVIILSGIVALLTDDYLIYLVLSLGYIVMLDKQMRALTLLDHNSLLFHERYLAGLFFACLWLGMAMLYRSVPVMTEWRPFWATLLAPRRHTNKPPGEPGAEPRPTARSDHQNS